LAFTYLPDFSLISEAASIALFRYSDREELRGEGGEARPCSSNLNSGAFGGFFLNKKIQDGGSKMAAV